MYSYNGKAEFLSSLLQSSVSHDPSEINLKCWFASQKTFPIFINVKKVQLLNFVETMIFSSTQGSLNNQNNIIYLK